MKSTHPLIPAPHIEGLIFDLDGTLADTMPIHLEAWRLTGNIYNVEITDQMINDRAGTPTIQVIEQLSELFDWQIDPVEFRLRKNKVYTSLKTKNGKIKPIPSVLNIAKIYQQSLPMAIGTGSIKKNADMALEDLGIAEWFQIMVTADDVEKHKPYPETFLKCGEGIGISPEKCFVYEDGQMGIQAALAAGMSAVNIQTLEIYHP